MRAIKMLDNYNYIAVFLTLSCNVQCSYCINRFDGFNYKKGHLTGEQWINGLNRIVSRADLPLTLQGGEPSLHPDFYYILNNIKNDLNVDILTNLQFDLDEFMKEVDPDRIKRESPYASIRVSYHPENMDIDFLVDKTLRLQNAGYSIGVWGVLHPAYENEINRARECCRSQGIDFRTKEFLGEYRGRIYGTFKYPDACERKEIKKVICRTTEFIIGPDGGVYRCHSDLYAGRETTGSIIDPDFEIDGRFLPCNSFGHCNPCDVKIKTNRFQVFGHTSVEIRFGTGRQ